MFSILVIDMEDFVLAEETNEAKGSSLCQRVRSPNPARVRQWADRQRDKVKTEERMRPFGPVRWAVGSGPQQADHCQGSVSSAARKMLQQLLRGCCTAGAHGFGSCSQLWDQPCRPFSVLLLKDQCLPLTVGQGYRRLGIRLADSS